MLFAGLYETWYPTREQPEVTLTIVTCAANALLGEVHDRMPAILDEGGRRLDEPTRAEPSVDEAAARAGV
jgi:putative SOS response-associated peptidase YedK